MIKIFLLAFIIYSVHSSESRSWGGRDWQSNSGGNEGGNQGGGNGGGGDEGKWDEGKDQWAPARYQFKYGVEDEKTGDMKQQVEERIKDRVVGQYSLKEPDGTIRIVKYEADDKNGFNAQVIREGKARHPSGEGRRGKYDD